jgi:hypothetical protein
MMRTAIGLMVLVAIASPAEAAAPASGKCGEEKPRPRGGEWTPPPGIPLLAGIATGMSRADVRRIDRRLGRSEASGSVELVAGVRMRGYVLFDGEPEGAVGFELHAARRYPEALAALRARFGPERVLDSGKRFIGMPNGFPNGVIDPDPVRLAWCEGARTIILSGEKHDFSVTIRPTRP